MLLSIIVPCFNEEESVPIFYESIFNELKDIKYEIIYINDGSTDNTLYEIKNLADNHSNVKYLSFSRNFGKESALYAGLKNAEGDLICVIDVDLQHPPSLIPQMMHLILEENFDVVAARRISRKGESKINSFFSTCFYKIFNKISNLNLVEGATDYRVMTKQVVDSILALGEYNRFSKGLFQWVGFNITWIPYENVERVAGQTSWSLFGLFKYSIEAIVAFTTSPLNISTFFGILFSLMAFIYIIIILFEYLLFSNQVQGYSSLMCTILILGGIQLFSIGILGKYLEKTYIETKNRPIFIVKESNINNYKL